MMLSKSFFTTRIDVIGASITFIGLCVGVWFGLLKSDSAAAELGDILGRQIDIQSEHSSLQKTVEYHLTEWRRLKDQAKAEGKLDDQAPVQDRLRAVREMADRHGWEDVQIMPVQWRRAADVAEQTFQISATADYIELMSFFRAFESDSAWADISHLNIRPAQKGNGANIQHCRVDMTLNFYSSYEDTDETRPPISP